MAGSILNHDIADIITKYGLSERSARNSVQGHPWDKLAEMLANSWSPGNPEGSVADNQLQQQEVATYITNNLVFDSSDHLGYGVGPRGSPRLKRALASFFNSDFRAHEPVKEADVIVFPEVIAVLDALAWSICNENKGIITPMPFYTGLKPANTWREIARFCGSNGLHLIRDEIFAKSVHDNPHASHGGPHTSVLSLDLSDCIDRHLVHVASGLRLGVLVSKSEGLLAAVTSIWQDSSIYPAERLP
ncbi:hypothetical protein ANO14919_137550 [Xylariales sp. No.14919]|nr:hypothetical protein ANO14919_137550 [Xylariales sp. No.14919]